MNSLLLRQRPRFLNGGLNLLLLLGLALTGCASHQAAKEAQAYHRAIQMVLDAREDIRQIISHPPRTAAEIAGPAHGDPAATLFRVADYAQRLTEIQLTGCPPEFRAAFTNYVTAWQERAVLTPDLELPTAPATPVPEASSAGRQGATATAWLAVQRVVEKYAQNPADSNF